MNTDDVLKYIKEEREISDYQIKMLRRASAKKSYAKRLLAKELEFKEFPFEKIPFSSLDEARKALVLFKSSKKEFLNKYSFIEEIDSGRPLKRDISSIEKRLIFFKERYKSLLMEDVILVNILDDKYFNDLFLKSYSNKKSLSINDARDAINNLDREKLLNLEGSVVGKQRARTQACVYSIARNMHNFMKNCELMLFEVESKKRKEVGKFIFEIDNKILSLEDYIFKYYNEGLIELDQVIANTDGRNEFLLRISPIYNVFDDSSYNLPDFILYKSHRIPILKNKFFVQTIKSVSDAEHTKGTNSIGIMIPMKRIGNETIDILYRNIIINNKSDITGLFKRKFSNIKCATGGDELYFKCIASTLQENMKNSIDINALDDNIYNLLNISGSSKRRDNFTRIEVGSESRLLVPTTRSESERLKDAAFWCTPMINKIRNDYKRSFKITTNHV